MLIYCWIEDFRNIKEKGVSFAPHFDIVVSGANTVYMGNTNTKYIPMRYHKRKVTIKKKCTSNENISLLIGKNATGKSNILDCINLHYREHDKKFCFFVFYDPSDGLLYIESYGIELEIECDILFSEKRDDHNLFHYYTKNIFKTDGVHYTYDKSVNAGCFWTSHTFLSFANVSKNEIRHYLSKGFETVINFKDQLLKRFNGDLGKLIITLPPKDDKRQHDPYFIYAKPYNKPYAEINNQEAKTYFIYWLFENTRTQFFRFMSSFFHRSGEWNKWQEDNEALLEKFFANRISLPNDPHNKGSQWQNYDFNSILNAIDSFFDVYFKLGATFPSTQYLLPSQKEFVKAFKTLLQMLIKLDEKYFTAFFKLEIEFDTAFTDLVGAWEVFLGKGRVFNDKETGNTLVHGIAPSIEYWSAGQEQFIRFLSLLSRDLHWHTRCGNYILLIDEPDTHIDIHAQAQFLDNIKNVVNMIFSKNGYSSFQIIIATHSQFIIKNGIETYNGVLQINNCYTQNNLMQVETIKHTAGISTPMSYGQILFEFFGMSTVDFHIELYGAVERKANIYGVVALDNWFDIQNGVPRLNSLVPITHNGHTDLTLPYYIRNYLSHQNGNRDNACLKRLKESIEFMITLL